MRSNAAGRTHTQHGLITSWAAMLRRASTAGHLDGAAHAMWILTSATNDPRGPEFALRSLNGVLERTERDEREKYGLVADLTRLVAYEYMTRNYSALGQHEKAVAVATLSVELAERFASPIRSAGALRQRIEANIAAGDALAAEIDIVAALAGLESVPLNSSTPRHREKLLALRVRLGSREDARFARVSS
jgi:hypothetical protein